MRREKITSTTNQRIKDAVQVRDNRARYKHTAFLIEGPHLVDMALITGAEIREIFVTEEFLGNQEHQSLLSQLAKTAGDMFEITGQVLRKITDTETPQGIVALVSYSPLKIEDLSLGEKTLLIVIDGIQDPGNLGTIIRTADAAGADAVVLLPGTCDAFMPKAIRATAGSIFNVPIVYAEQAGLLQVLRRGKVALAVTASDAGKSIFESDLSGPVAIVFGNEARGVSSLLKKSADLSLGIPIFGKAESLNVATSAAVCLYEAVRQRGCHRREARGT